ncbi:MAG: caspase family protein [Bacteroidales bacterium]|nr:caspase family protein [Bacteroidales bacterium]
MASVRSGCHINVRYLSFMLFILSQFFTVTQAQRVRSGKSSIQINNLRIEEEITPDTTPPLLKIISPEITEKGTFQSSLSEVNIFGKITDNESGINKVFINSEEINLTKDGLFVQQVQLKKGENKVSIIAIDNEDNYSETGLVINYMAASQLITTQLEIKGRYYALLVGVDEYGDANLMDLDNPVRDAENLYNVLVSDYCFDKENAVLLKNAKRAEITDALDIMAEKITSDDNFLIFYAGHGWWDKDANVGYWLPSDARISRKADWIGNSTLCDYLKVIDSKHTLLIADACFAGSIFKTRSVSMEAPKAIQKLYDLPSRKAMTSGTLTEVPDRSSFVKYLIERLAANEDKCISSEQLFSSFRIAVINNSDVIPQYGEIRNVGDQGGDFIFIKRD